ncbi:hypothetical protein XELAEV_18007564mg [Xenopus laevis]|uniref:Uncharacterized protein n=1 Tax=Xenopus laevis TaxID=8355 RepID=A0A974E2K7_XENLA|nr:hypothetical protein XELAEV_18007564mg [Xenopus laevis]
MSHFPFSYVPIYTPFPHVIFSFHPMLQADSPTCSSPIIFTILFTIHFFFLRILSNPFQCAILCPSHFV